MATSRRFRSVRNGSFLALAAAALTGLLFLGIEVNRELTELQSAPRDNVHWTLSQMEVDLLLLTSAGDAALGSGELAPFRQRFDLFYSRVSSLRDGAFVRSLDEDSAVTRSLDEIRRHLDRATPLIDGPDQALEASLAELVEIFRGMRSDVRGLSLEGVRIFAEMSDTRRKVLSDLLIQAAAVAAGLIIALVASIFFLLRQYRISMRKTEEAAGVADRLKRTIDASLDAIVVADMEGRIVEYNPAAEQTFGFARDDVLGRPLGDLMVPERYRDAHAAGLKRFLDTGEKRVVDQGRVHLEALREDGTEFPIEMSIGVAGGPSEPMFIAYIRDISSRLEVENALTEARDDALAADRAKSSFLAVMSHEMRTPLNGVIGTLELLRETPLDAEQRRIVEIAQLSIDILLRHIDDVLDIAKIEANKFELAPLPFDLNQVIEHVVELNRPIAAARGTSIAIASRVPEPATYVADRLRIQQIMLNLVGNAVKFTENGRIGVSAIETNAGEGQSTLELAVEDTGIGIHASDQQKIFEDFVALDPSYSRDTTGSGLGLSITRRIVEAMSGTFGVVSAPGAGSRFWIRLPLRRSPEVKALPPEPLSLSAAPLKTLRPCIVLVVEDNDVNRFVIKKMLQSQGCSVTEASDGRQGVSLAAGRCFDLIFMDISMPGMDGLQACEAIRAGTGASRESAIVGLTAHALPEEHRRYLAAGMNACLVKPLRRADLEKALDIHGKAFPRSGLAPFVASANDNRGSIVDRETFDELSEILTAPVMQTKINTFGTDLETGLDDVDAALRRHDHHAAGERAHALSGAAAFFGATRLRSLLLEIERHCRDGSTVEARDAHARTVVQVPLTMDALNTLSTPGERSAD